MEYKTVIDKSDLTKLHVKLDLLWLLLGNVAIVEGFPKEHIEYLRGLWEKVKV